MQGIPSSESFADLLKTRPLKKTARLMLHHIPEDRECAIGVLVPKRMAKRAIDRNTLKRLAREACRLRLQSVRGRVLIRITKAVVSVPDSDRAGWWTELHQLLDCLSQTKL